jgi:hypothetical protein
LDGIVASMVIANTEHGTRLSDLLPIWEKSGRAPDFQ